MTPASDIGPYLSSYTELIKVTFFWHQRPEIDMTWPSCNFFSHFGNTYLVYLFFCIIYVSIIVYYYSWSFLLYQVDLDFKKERK